MQGNKNMLFIATPCFDTVTLQFHLSMGNLTGYLTANKIPYQFATLTDCNLCRSRAELTAAFLQHGAEKMLFLDSDMQFTPEDVMRITSHDLPIVAGTYPKRRMRWDLVEKAIKDGDPRYACYGDYTFTVENDKAVINNGLLKVKHAPTGFMLIQRHVIEKVIGAYPELQYHSKQYGKNVWAIYDNLIVDYTYLSTDFSFCERARRCGFPVYVDLTLKLNHVGTHVFEGDPMVCVKS
jgi:hypothetical protein